MKTKQEITHRILEITESFATTLNEKNLQPKLVAEYFELAEKLKPSKEEVEFQKRCIIEDKLFADRKKAWADLSFAKQVYRPPSQDSLSDFSDPEWEKIKDLRKRYDDINAEYEKVATDRTRAKK